MLKPKKRKKIWKKHAKKTKNMKKHMKIETKKTGKSRKKITPKSAQIVNFLSKPFFKNAKNQSRKGGSPEAP